MSKAKYLIRLDDACPTMNPDRWQLVEDLLDEFSIRPIVAVIPENKDSSMIFVEESDTFWDLVQAWKNKGWEIALHGHTHLMRKTKAKQILPFYDRSEFSGLSYEEQKEKILAGLGIFRENNIPTRIFVAPAHCFDRVTVEVLTNETDIRIISDGISIRPFFQHNLLWIPQQLSSFGPKPFGVWTICLHPNTCDDFRLTELRMALASQRSSFICVDDLNLKSRRQKSVSDYLYEIRFWYRRGKLRRLLFNV